MSDSQCTNPGQDCSVCDGRGRRTSDEPYMQMQTEECTACKGTGRVGDPPPPSETPRVGATVLARGTVIGVASDGAALVKFRVSVGLSDESSQLEAWVPGEDVQPMGQPSTAVLDERRAIAMWLRSPAAHLTAYADGSFAVPNESLGTTKKIQRACAGLADALDARTKVMCEEHTQQSPLPDALVTVKSYRVLVPCGACGAAGDTPRRTYHIDDRVACDDGAACLQRQQDPQEIVDRIVEANRPKGTTKQVLERRSKVCKICDVCAVFAGQCTSCGTIQTDRE